MTLDQAEYFIAIAEFGSFSKAAAKLHLSQPSLSIAISKIEKEMGVKLFENKRKTASLTDAGCIFLEDCRKLVRQKEKTINHMRHYTKRETAELRIAYTASFADQTIPDLLETYFRTRGKHTTVYADEMPSDQIAKALRENEIDLGLCSTLPKDPLLKQFTLIRQSFCLITSQKDKTDYEDPENLRNVPFIGYHPDYPMYRALMELFESLKIDPKYRSFCYSEASIARLVQRDLGVGIIAETEGSEKYEIQIMKPSWLKQERELVLVYGNVRPLRRSAIDFMQVVFDHFHLDIPNIP